MRLHSFIFARRIDAVRSLRRALAAVVIACSVFSPAALSQKKHSAATKPPVAAWTARDCGHGVQLRLSSVSASQGSLLLLEVRSPKPLVELKGAWQGNPIPFWTESSKGSPQMDIRRGLLGVDLEQAPGDGALSVTESTADDPPANCSVNIEVRAGKFATERLKVAPNFVEPNPEQLAKADEDRKKLRAIFDAITPEKLWQGTFRIPLDGATTGSNFGRRRVLNGQPSSPHSGVDIPAPTGTPVHAAQNGRVVLAEELYFSGNTVVVDHGLGVYTLYGHFSEIDVKAGDEVAKGDVLGKVGATGRVTGPHLHWGLEVSKARVNALAIAGSLGWK
jgi:murein DD-endopeptidase MepM/ murein hydrolase activator NlpD